MVRPGDPTHLRDNDLLLVLRIDATVLASNSLFHVGTSVALGILVDSIPQSPSGVQFFTSIVYETRNDRRNVQSRRSP